MQNTLQKFRERSLVFEKPGILSKNLQLSYSSTCFAETSHTFSTYQCLQKRVSFVKIQKTWFLHTPFLHFYE